MIKKINCIFVTVKLRNIILVGVLLAFISCRNEPVTMQEVPTITGASVEASRFSATVKFGISGKLEGIAEAGVSYGNMELFQDVLGTVDNQTRQCIATIENLSAGTEYSYKCFI